MSRVSLYSNDICAHTFYTHTHTHANIHPNNPCVRMCVCRKILRCNSAGADLSACARLAVYEEKVHVTVFLDC